MNATTLKAGLIGLIGWRQNPDPSGTQLSELTSSSSGLYFNDEHPLLTHENLMSINDEDDLYTFVDYDATTTYSVGAIVNYQSTNYICILAGTGKTPSTETAYWKEYNRYEEWLKERTEAGILEALNDWYAQKVRLRTAKNLLDNDTLFSERGNVSDTITNDSKIVGLEILPRSSKSLMMSVYKLGVQFTENQTLSVKVFESGTKAAIYTESITYTGAGGVEWHTVDWELSGDKIYYVVYDQAAISGQAINGIGREYVNEKYYWLCGRYYKAQAISHSEGMTTMWDYYENANTLSTNYGLNLKFSVKCDYTQFILDQKDEFKLIIAKRVAIKMLKELVYNPNARVNRHEQNINDNQLLYEINGEAVATAGNNRSLSVQYEKALESVMFDTTGIDKVCLPCKRRGIRVGAVH